MRINSTERNRHPGRRQFLIDVSWFSGTSLLLATLGCGAKPESYSKGDPDSSTDDSGEMGITGGKGRKPYLKEDLIEDLLSNDQENQEIKIPAGTYEIDIDEQIRQNKPLISTMFARKLIGSGSVKIVFMNVPDNVICLDFQNKSRIRNISFEIRPKNGISALNITMIRFRRVVRSYVKSAEIGVKLPNEGTSSGTLRKLLDINLMNDGVVRQKRDSITKRLKGTVTPLNVEAPKPLVVTFFDDYQCSVSKEFIRPRVWTFNGENFEEFFEGDEADMDSGFNDCKFSFASMDNLPAKGIIAVDYVGRNLVCKDNAFENIGTAIRLSFPPTKSLTDPSSYEVRNQNGFYGHRKGRIFRNIFDNVARCLHITGPVTLRALNMTENIISGGQLIYCDDKGGMRASIVAQNKIENHKDNMNDYNATILIKNGYFDDNIITNNTFSGSTSRFIEFRNTATICRGNIIAENTFSGSTHEAIKLEKTLKSGQNRQSVLITMNSFESYRLSDSTQASNPETAIFLGLLKNQTVSFNKVNYNSNTKTFVKLPAEQNTSGITNRLRVMQNTKKNQTLKMTIVDGKRSEDSSNIFIQEKM